ncbi:DNA cytosine methyltransferase [Streptomyces sp. SID14515]|uniref:DNA cytosine methyltransferase n=1 Tax=Streptomyces sp. SID14515 TaxID=2706074 RepID=UPI0013C68406|nr:DNA cytosine methyltransferase [Streptomyces sp. SID14515]NEB42321.1 DNA cytosine methyltransferase [Streptomyces sp. SID14515]
MTTSNQGDTLNAHPDLIVEGFHGPGGLAEGRRILGLRTRAVGMEWDAAACATAKAAGHTVVRCDVATMPTAPFRGRVKIKVDSPPCQAWSDAGKREGLIDQPLVHQAVEDLARGRDTRARLLTACKDKRSLLAAEPMRWHHDLRPETIVMEEVPRVLPLWQQYARVLRAWGYSVWVGVLNAADYGVPQTRRRAILIASLVRDVAPPAPTHTEHPAGEDLFGDNLPGWVTMAEALHLETGIDVITRGNRKTPGGNAFPADAPSWALTEKAPSWVLHSRRDSPAWIAAHGARENRTGAQPAPSITGEAHRWYWTADGDLRRPLSLAEAATLQSFPADHPWHGARTRQFLQVGNAVPPLLAAHVLSAATGIPMPVAADLRAAA